MSTHPHHTDRRYHFARIIVLKRAQYIESKHTDKQARGDWYLAAARYQTITGQRHPQAPR